MGRVDICVAQGLRNKEQLNTCSISDLPPEWFGFVDVWFFFFFVVATDRQLFPLGGNKPAHVYSTSQS